MFIFIFFIDIPESLRTGGGCRRRKHSIVQNQAGVMRSFKLKTRCSPPATFHSPSEIARKALSIKDDLKGLYLLFPQKNVSRSSFHSETILFSFPG